MAEAAGAQQDRTILLIATGARQNKVNIPQAVELMRDVPVGISETAEWFDVTENTVRNLFDRLESHKIILSTPDGNRLTGFGLMIAREQQRALDVLSTTVLSKFGSSEAWSAILRALQVEALGRNELADSCNISRRTSRDVCANFVEKGWIAYDEGKYQLLPLGVSKLSAYNEFEEAIDLISEKKEFVLRLENLAQEFPLAALRDTDMATGSSDNPHAVLTLLENESETNVDTLRGIQQSFSPQMVDAYDPLVPKRKKIELIIDRSVFRRVTKIRNLHYLRSGFKFDNFQLLIYPEPLSFGIGIFGNERALIGVYTDNWPYNAAIVSSNDALVDWCTQKYEEMRDHAQTPTERLLNWVLS